MVIACLLAACGGGGGGNLHPGVEDNAATKDKTAPQITAVTGIIDGQVITSSAVLSATATDETGVDRFVLKVNGETVVDAAKATIDYSWDVRDIPSGAYTLTFLAYDAAGNQDSKKFVIHVSNGNNPPAEEPNLAELLAPVETSEYNLPAMAEWEYQPADQQIPRAIVSGITDGGTVHDDVYLSAVGTDDTRVNTMALVIDGHQVDWERASSLTYTWRTTDYTDGMHTLVFIMRDDGARIGRCQLSIRVDNLADRTGPEIDLLTESTCLVQGETYSLVEYHSSISYTWELRASGEVTLRISAVDASRAVYIELNENGSRLASINGDNLTHTLLESEIGDDNWIRLEILARDIHGNETKNVLSIAMIDSFHLSGQVAAANGVLMAGAAVRLLTGEIGTPELARAVDAWAETSVNRDGEFSFSDVPCGKWTIHAAYGDYQVVKSFSSAVQKNRSFRDTDRLVLPGLYGSAKPNRRLAVVTGTADDIPAVIARVRESGFGQYIDNDTGELIPEEITLIDGDGTLGVEAIDFLSLLSNPAQLYQYRYLIVEGGSTVAAQWAANPQAVEALRNWIADGGQMGLINDAYDYFEQLFPTVLDFAGSYELNGLGNQPEALSAALVGPDVAYDQLFFYGSAYQSRDNFVEILRRKCTYQPYLAAPAAGWALIDNYDSAQAERWIWANWNDAGTVNAAPIVVAHRHGLGRIALLCFSTTQPEAIAADIAGGILDAVVFAY